MKLDEMHSMNIGQSNLLRTARGSEVPSKKALQNSLSEPVEGDEVVAGSHRGLLSLALALESPDFGSQRVAELRAQVENGTYFMDLPEVSRAIVDSALNNSD